MNLRLTLTAAFAAFLLAGVGAVRASTSPENESLQASVAAARAVYTPTLLWKPQADSRQAYRGAAEQMVRTLEDRRRTIRRLARDLRRDWMHATMSQDCAGAGSTGPCDADRRSPTRALRRSQEAARLRYLDGRRPLVREYRAAVDRSLQLRTLLEGGYWDRTYEEVAFGDVVARHDDLMTAANRAGTAESDAVIWPARGPVTARFLSPSYEARFAAVHLGSDIAVPQGTPVRSMMDGVVIAASAANSDSYAFLAVAHRDGWVSVYGHLSVLDQRVGDLVRAGNTIGRSGGAVETTGAGHRTTGAHLHLELMQWGVRVDPIEFLRHHGNPR